ncbi:MAG: hypothetical protein K0R68_1041, partial [Mycobacterium sp.]|nr:hypothetical protein [Mycobacterium sp.]
MNLLPTPEATLRDDDVEDALARAVKIIGPLLDLLWGTDPLGLKRRPRAADADTGPLEKVAGGIGWALNAADVPGTDAREDMDVDARISWWIWRVGAVNN